MKAQLLIGAVAPGSGKTTFTIGLLRALCRRGLQVQPFKCGPDYIDTQYHTLAAGKESVNLDTWLASQVHVQRLYNRYGDGADVCVTEGAMGLFDGYRKMQGSSAELAHLLRIPVILLVGARSAAYSVAALIHGFKTFCPAVKVVGVVFNQVASPSQFAYLKAVCADAGVDCLGCLPQAEELKMPSRHLGLTLTAKRTIDLIIEQVAEQVEKYVDLDRLLNTCQRTFPCPYSLPYTSEAGVDSLHPVQGQRLRIAVASDPAFNFVYRENRTMLERKGTIINFSPVYGNDLPAADLIYLPGGYPELFARQLHRRRRLMEQLRDYVEAGGKVLAECGGMVFLSRSLTARKGGTAYEMAGILPLECTMADARLYQGYRRVVLPNGVELRGHEYHYSSVLAPGAMPSIARQYNARGGEVDTPLYRYKNVIAGYTHLYWGETDIMKLWD